MGKVRQSVSLQIDALGYISYKNNPLGKAEDLELIGAELESLEESCVQMEEIGLSITTRNLFLKNLWKDIDIPLDPMVFVIERLRPLYQHDDSGLLFYSESTWNTVFSCHVYRIRSMDKGHGSSEFSFIFKNPTHFNEVMSGLGYTKVSSFPSLEGFKGFIRQMSLKAWDFDPERHLLFARRSAATGNVVEISERDYLKLCDDKRSTIICDGQGNYWKLTSIADKGRYYAIRKDENSHYLIITKEQPRYLNIN